MHAGTAKAQEFLNAKCPILQTKQSAKFLTESSSMMSIFKDNC